MSASRLVFFAALAAAVGSCGGVEEAGGMCKVDSDCLPGEGCVSRACVAKAQGQAAAAWSVEVVPRPEGNWAHSEVPAANLDMTALVLRAERKVTVSGTLERAVMDERMPERSTVRLALSWPSKIPGKRDRVVETQGTTREPRGPLEFSVDVPESALGQQVTVRIIPVTPLDAVLPPWTVSAVLERAMRFDVLGPNALYVVQGTLQSALTEPLMGYTARALLGGRVVSTVALTDGAGGFTLAMPRTDGGVPLPLREVSVELSGGTMMSSQLRLQAPLLADGRLPVPPLRLPPFPKAEPFEVPVIGIVGDKTEKVSGATVRFRAVVAGATGGQAVFTREAQTDKDGVARVELLPGTSGETRSYAVSVIAPSGSPYSSRCVPMYAVAAGGARVAASIDLAAKPVVTGQVFRADGVPVRDARVTATRQGDAYVEACGSEIAPAPAVATTARDGSFRLLVEPGTYRFDYEPPADTAAPLHAEPAVTVTSTLRHDVTLPPGVFVDGQVVAPDGAPVVGCDVRAYAPDDGAVLGGRARTGAGGRFRMVLPRR